MRASTLLVPLLVIGCARPAPSGAAPDAASTATVTRGPDTEGSDEAVFNAWQSAVERQVEADARAGATRTFKSQDEARQFLSSITPSGFRPRPEFFASLEVDAGDVQSFAKRMAAFARGHPDKAERRMQAFMATLKPVLAQISANIDKQFPSRWASDPTAALADARTRKKAALLVFCAEWAAACSELDRTFSDPAVEKVLDDRFVSAYVNVTDDAPAFKVESVPLILVFDKSGQEVARQTGAVDAPGLLGLLGRAK